MNSPRVVLVSLVCAASLLAARVAPEPGPIPAPAAAADSGFERFLEDRADKAKVASRSKDWAAASAAWLEVLELDPSSQQALEGLIDVAERQGDVDAEALYRREFNALLGDRVARGEATLARTLATSVERMAAIDPFDGEAAELVDDYAEAVHELAQLYERDGMDGNALVTWRARLDSVPLDSPEAAEALAALDRILTSGDDWLLSLGVVPELPPGGKSAEWIEAFDAKHSRWSRAATRDTPHYRIKTNAGWHMLEGASLAMEQVNAFYREVWGIQPDPAPERVDPALRNLTVPPIDVFIYATHAEYLKRSGAVEWSGGQFNGSEVATYDHGEGGGGNSIKATMQTLFHEASHQFMHVAVGPSAPSFINEGVACLFEGIEILPNGSIRRDLPVPGRLTSLAQRVRQGFKARQIIEGENAYSNEPSFYAPRWGLIYFLRMYVDDQGTYVFRDRLTDYIYEFKRGGVGDAVEHFEEFFLDHLQVPGLETFDQFDEVWQRWIVDLEAERKELSGRIDDYKKRGRLEGLKKKWETSLRFYERAFDIDPSDLDSIFGLAEAAAALEQPDRAVVFYRRFLTLSDEEDAKRRKEAAQAVARLDPHDSDWQAARRALVGGMAGLALRYDGEDMPLMAMRVAHDVLEIEPLDASSLALVGRLERETGRSVLRWQRLFNGFDLEGWWHTGGAESPFYTSRGELVCDYGLVLDEDAPSGEAGNVSLYRNLFLDRDVKGTWKLETRIRTGRDWEIVGLCFGAQDAERYEAVVLRKGPDGKGRVDFGSFDGEWSFRGDGAMKADYDPSSLEGTLLRVEVDGREVSVTIDGVPLPVIDGGKSLEALTYPVAALRGDVGLLASRGKTRFTDLRLFAAKAR